jgi:DnaJ-class molecular chaperone
MGSNYIPKCKVCKGVGFTDKDSTCKSCEGTGVRLQNDVDEDLNEYFAATGERIYPDEEGFLDIEEEDYEV